MQKIPMAYFYISPHSIWWEKKVLLTKEKSSDVRSGKMWNSCTYFISWKIKGGSVQIEKKGEICIMENNIDKNPAARTQQEQTDNSNILGCYKNKVS